MCGIIGIIHLVFTFKVRLFQSCMTGSKLPIKVHQDIGGKTIEGELKLLTRLYVPLRYGYSSMTLA